MESFVTKEPKRDFAKGEIKNESAHRRNTPTAIYLCTVRILHTDVPVTPAVAIKMRG